MTTTAPRYKAGGLPPTQLHRVDASLLDCDKGRAVGGCMLDDMPIQYATSDLEEWDAAEQQRLTNYYRGMRNAIPRHEPQQVEKPKPDDEDGPEEMLAAVIVLTVVCVVLGFFIAGMLT